MVWSGGCAISISSHQSNHKQIEQTNKQTNKRHGLMACGKNSHGCAFGRMQYRTLPRTGATGELVGMPCTRMRMRGFFFFFKKKSLPFVFFERRHGSYLFG